MNEFTLHTAMLHMYTKNVCVPARERALVLLHLGASYSRLLAQHVRHQLLLQQEDEEAPMFNRVPTSSNASIRI